MLNIPPVRAPRRLLLALVALAVVVPPSPAAAVVPAWTTLIQAEDGGTVWGTATVGGRTYLLMQSGDLCRLARVGAAGAVLWIRQVGSAPTLRCSDVSADPTGVYVTMSAIGDFDGADDGPGWNNYLRKFSFAGDERWTSVFSRPDAIAWSVAASGDGVYLAGYVLSSTVGGPDAFLRRYDPDGTLDWTRHYRTDDNDVFLTVTADAGGAYVGGHSFTAGTSFVRRYAMDGTADWTTPIPAEDNSVVGLVTDGVTLYAGGLTSGVFPGKENAGGLDVWVATFDTATGAPGWVRQFGSAGQDHLSDVALGPAGVYAIGTTYGSLPRFEQLGHGDAFVRSYTTAGKRRWTRQFGTHREDVGRDAVADAEGIVVIGGTYGNLGDGRVETRASFLRRYVPA
jgi:hypothetical protein